MAESPFDPKSGGITTNPWLKFINDPFPAKIALQIDVDSKGDASNIKIKLPLEARTSPGDTSSLVDIRDPQFGPPTEQQVWVLKALYMTYQLALMEALARDMKATVQSIEDKGLEKKFAALLEAVNAAYQGAKDISGPEISNKFDA